MKKVVCEANAVWNFFQKNKTKLLTGAEIIATNDEFEVVIYLTAEEQKTGVYPRIEVFIEDSDVYSEVAADERDCEQTVKKIYCDYLTTENLINRIIREAEKEPEFDELAAEERDLELDDAVDAMLEVFLNSRIDKLVGYSEADKIRCEIVDKLCEYLYLECDLSVYRPTILEDESGEEFFAEYPYECMIFDN